MLDQVDMESNDIILPTHLKCICHTLNLVATKDSEKALDNGKDIKSLPIVYIKMHQTSIQTKSVISSW